MKFSLLSFSAAIWVASLVPAGAQSIEIGATLSTTGPSASIGIPIKKTLEILPKTIDGVSVSWTILDDAGDTTQARRNVEKLTAGNVDLMIGGNTTPTALATVDIAGQTGTPVLAIAPSPSVIEPVEGARRWMFKIPLGERELSVATLNDMVKRGVKTVGFIGFNDSFGDGWVTELNRSAASHDIKIVDTERFARADTSVTAQVLRLLSARPDAVLIAATGTPAVLPTLALRDRGFRGPIYEASGVINNDFLRLGGNGVEGVLVAGGPLVASDRLPDSNPVKAVSRTFVAMYEKVYGPGSVSLFAGNAYDAWLLISRAVPIALQQAKPGTPQFRGALRAAIESTKNFPVTNGVVNLSPTNHGIYAADAPVVLTVKHGAWALAN